MPLKIDTGSDGFVTKSAFVDDTQVVRFTDYIRADRFKRQTIAQIESLEYSIEVDRFLEAESITLDGLHLYSPQMAADVQEAAENHKAILKSGGVESDAPDPRPAEPGTHAQLPNTGKSANAKGKTMFQFDTANSGASGPFIAWTPRGTQDGAVPAKSFYLRTTDGKEPLEAFKTGVVMDIENMKTGWQRSEGIVGQAPEWKWNQTVAHMMPQPAEDWSKGFSIRCAIGGGETATWEQASTAVWDAFTGIVPALQQGPGDGFLPLVRIVDTKPMQFKRGSTVAPVLEVVKWVPRPDCLKEGAPTIATEPAPAPAPTQAAKPAPEPATVDDDLDF
jgi:hypothetical protein